MPDSLSNGPAVPQDWHTAFAAMPLETPPADGWTQLRARLPARRRSRARYWVPAAMAASLALLMLWPRQPEPIESPAAVAAHRTPEAPPRDAATSVAGVTEGTQNTRAVPVETTPADAVQLAQATQPPARTTRTIDRPRTGGRVEAQPRETAPAAIASVPDPSRSATTPPAQTDNTAALETLYAESAQLEALLAQVSDDRVASGPAMALSAELHDRVASIDVALSQPDVDAQARVGLWRERVATLQRLTGVEGTQRWMAANGYRADGAVAQIY